MGAADGGWPAHARGRVGTRRNLSRIDYSIADLFLYDTSTLCESQDFVFMRHDDTGT